MTEIPPFQTDAVLPAMTINDLYHVVYRPERDPSKHYCGLITDFPDVSIGSVVQCRTCGKYWKRRPNWIDGEQRWSWETRKERRRRRDAPDLSMPQPTRPNPTMPERKGA